jgi:hypothetical protein
MLTAATSPQAAVRKVRCCNRAATEAGRTLTEQENIGAGNGKNCLDKLEFLTGQYLPGRLRPNLQGGGRWFESRIAHL